MCEWCDAVYDLTYMRYSFLAVTFEKYVSEFKWIVPCSLGTAVIIDAVTSSTLTYYLHKCRTGFKR